MNKVINTHWYGSPEKLPSTAKYVGRPSEHGNTFSSKSGQYSKEECVALHRVDLYLSLITDRDRFAKLKAELFGYDLACWCAQEKKVCACHADNFLHIFSPELADRDYTKTVYHYLIDDLQRIMGRLKHHIHDGMPEDKSLEIYIAFCEIEVEVIELLRLFRVRETDAYLRCVWLANVIIDLELAMRENDLDMRLFRLDHCVWTCFRFTYRPESRDEEPIPPNRHKVKKPKEGYPP